MQLLDDIEEINSGSNRVGTGPSNSGNQSPARLDSPAA